MGANFFLRVDNFFFFKAWNKHTHNTHVILILAAITIALEIMMSLCMFVRLGNKH